MSLDVNLTARTVIARSPEQAAWLLARELAIRGIDTWCVYHHKYDLCIATLLPPGRGSDG